MPMGIVTETCFAPIVAIYYFFITYESTTSPARLMNLAWAIYS
jgi:hypothetical protein